MRLELAGWTKVMYASGDAVQKLGRHEMVEDGRVWEFPFLNRLSLGSFPLVHSQMRGFCWSPLQ